MNKNCLSYWYPRLQTCDVRTPKTIIIPGPDGDLLSLCDGEEVKGFDLFISNLRAAAERIGWPIFLRSGMFSAKHFKNAPRVESRTGIPQAVYQITEASHLVSLMGLSTDKWAVREFINGESPFTAFDGLPIRRERRYFIEGGNVIAHIPYWTEEAIRKPSRDDWRVELGILNEELPGEVEYLSMLSRHVSKGFEDAWSLDWMWDGSVWWAIDMALAKESWGCPDELSV